MNEHKIDLNKDFGIGEVSEYVQYSVKIEQTITELQNPLTSVSEPKEIALRALQTAVDFYDADWCGAFDVDLELRIFTPFWWFNRKEDGMSQAIVRECGTLEYKRWAESLKLHKAIIIQNIEDIRETNPEEYNFYRRLGVNNLMAIPFWKGPIGYLVLKNPRRFTNQSSFLWMLSYVVLNALSEHFMIETSKLTLTSPRVVNDNDVYISVFGELKIVTCKGVLTESQLKSPKIARVLVYLLLSKKHGVSPREIASAIWPEEDTDIVVKNFKGLIYRLQQAFGLISDFKLVESTPNGYKLNSQLNITTDYQLFERKRINALNADSIEQKTDLLKKAAELYVGAFFQSASNEHWIMATTVEYYHRYVALVGELLKSLFEEKDYVCIQKYAAQALHYAPHSEVLYFWMIRSMIRIGHSEVARGELHTAKSKLLEEEYTTLVERLKQVGELP